MVDLIKFTSNKKIFSKVVVLGYNQICSKTLSKKKKKKLLMDLFIPQVGLVVYCHYEIAMILCVL